MSAQQRPICSRCWQPPGALPPSPLHRHPPPEVQHADIRRLGRGGVLAGWLLGRARRVGGRHDPHWRPLPGRCSECAGDKSPDKSPVHYNNGHTPCRKHGTQDRHNTADLTHPGRRHPLEVVTPRRVVCPLLGIWHLGLYRLTT